MTNEIQMTHAVIDLETMGVNNNAPVIEIGITLCNPQAGVLGETTGWRIPLQESLDMGFTLDASTVEWWLQQSTAAQDRFNFTKHQHDDDVRDISTALHRLTDFLERYGPDLLIVGNGPTFDLDLLRNVFDRVSKQSCFWIPVVPWQYWQERDLRSYLEMAAMMGFDKRSVPFEGVPHSGRDDSRHEAKLLIAAMQTVAATQRGKEFAETLLNNMKQNEKTDCDPGNWGQADRRRDEFYKLTTPLPLGYIVNTETADHD